LLTVALSAVTGLLCLTIAGDLTIDEALLFQLVLWTAVGSVPLRFGLLFVERRWRKTEETAVAAEAALDEGADPVKVTVNPMCEVDYDDDSLFVKTPPAPPSPADASSRNIPSA